MVKKNKEKMHGHRKRCSTVVQYTKISYGGVKVGLAGYIVGNIFPQQRN
jgi:hypothetical protein